MKVFLRKVALIFSNSLRAFYIGINSKQPRRDDAMNDSTEPIGLARASIRIAVAASVALLLGIGLFDIDDTWADGVETRIITHNCGESKVKNVKLKPSEGKVSFRIDGCSCGASAQEAKDKVLGYLSERDKDPTGLNFKNIQSTFSSYTIKPGKTITKIFYCYTTEQILDFLGPVNK